MSTCQTRMNGINQNWPNSGTIEMTWPILVNSGCPCLVIGLTFLLIMLLWSHKISQVIQPIISFVSLWYHIKCILLKAASVPLGNVVSLAAEWSLSFYPQSIGLRLPEFLQFLTLNNWFFVCSYCASALSLPAHTQGDDLIGPITVIYVVHAFKSSAAADVSLYT